MIQDGFVQVHLINFQAKGDLLGKRGCYLLVSINMKGQMEVEEFISSEA